MRRIGLLLCLALLARAGDDGDVVRIHDCADLKEDDTSWAIAVARVRAAAQGAKVELRESAMVVVAPPAVQEAIEKELSTVREALGPLVKLDVRFVKIEGGLGVASLPPEKLDLLVKEKRAEELAAPSLVCHNGQQACVSVLREIAYVSDFDVTLDDHGNLTADPVVSTIHDGITAKLRAFVSGQVIRVAAEVSITEVADQMAEVELPLPLPSPVKVQVPESATRSVSKLIECAGGSYAVLNLGGSRVVLIRATALPGVRLPGENLPGQEIELK